jgi:hypothetical protein
MALALKRVMRAIPPFVHSVVLLLGAASIAVWPRLDVLLWAVLEPSLPSLLFVLVAGGPLFLLAASAGVWTVTRGVPAELLPRLPWTAIRRIQRMALVVTGMALIWVWGRFYVHDLQYAMLSWALMLVPAAAILGLVTRMSGSGLLGTIAVASMIAGAPGAGTAVVEGEWQPVVHVVTLVVLWGGVVLFAVARGCARFDARLAVHGLLAGGGAGLGGVWSLMWLRSWDDHGCGCCGGFSTVYADAEALTLPLIFCLLPWLLPGRRQGR